MCESNQIYLDKMCQQKDTVSSVTRNTADVFFCCCVLELRKMLQ